MENTFTLLEQDDDVLLLNQDTFTVRKFRELVKREIYTKLRTKHNSAPLDINFCTLSISSEVQLLLNDIQWCNSPEIANFSKLVLKAGKKENLEFR